MKITVVSPLFPPDIATPALYVKELATRLSGTHHITLLIYSHLPEEVTNTNFIVIQKSGNTLTRVLACTIELWKTCKTADVILVQNGAATELPLILVSLFKRKKMILVQSDPKPMQTDKKNILLRSIHTLASLLAYKIIVDKNSLFEKKGTIYPLAFPDTKPEILPFEPYPTKSFEAYELTWKQHLQDIFKII